MALRIAIGAIKDQTSIGLAKVGSSNSLADLDVAIVRATAHEEYPAEEKYIREILSLTCYSRAYIGACVNTISRRLSKTNNWVVALKTLVLIHRLLIDGDPAYEQEIFFATRRGTRLLNLSDFRDKSRSNSWDYSAFVRTYALYLDERLEFRMQGKRKINGVCAYSYDQNPGDEDQENSTLNESSKNTPLCEQKTDLLLSKVHHLQQLLERLLATKPTGVARFNRIITVALYPVVKESFQLYYEITDILSVLIDRFMELDIPQCVKVHEVFNKISKQFDSLDAYYVWGRETGIARASEYPEVERITPKKLQLMDEFIRDKVANRQFLILPPEEENPPPQEEEEPPPDEDMNAIKTLPAPETTEEEKKEEEIIPKEEEPKEADLLHLGDDAPTTEEHGDKLALALFDGAMITTTQPPPSTSVWDAFNDSSDWETALVQSVSYLPHQKTDLGGGFDTLLLNGMYQQGTVNASLATNNVGGSGSASSVALGSVGNPKLLALPAPPPSSSSSSGESGASKVVVDPFAASLGVAPPPYVQMSDLEKKQRLMVDEQLVWQQYHRDGMQGQVALAKIQGQPPNVMGGYGYRY